MTSLSAPALAVARTGTAQDAEALAFASRVEDRTIKVGIVGLGYTGLPLALGFADAGFHVVGVDIDPVKVESVNRSESYLPDLTDIELQDVADRLTAVPDPSALHDADVVMICVPTPVTPEQTADLAYVSTAVDSVLPYLRAGSLVVLQSTVPAGTTAEIGRKITERTGLIPGEDLYLAMAPERVDPANTNGWTLLNTPKLVGGVGAESTRRAQLLLEQVCRTVVPVSSPDVAELSKVYENTFRLINIALSLELSDLCHKLGLPVREVIDAAATKPFGFLAHYPGPGVGGECIPVDPLFLSERARREGLTLGLVETAHRRISDRPGQVVARVGELLAARGRELKGARVLLVGVSYKAGVSDLRNAPAVDIVRGLRARGAEVSYVDPMVPGLEVDGLPVAAATWGREQLAAQDCVVLVTPHGRLASEPAWSAAPLVLDTRGELAPAANVEVL
ncbi:nucleotide sugar dehydrogenase [Streptomyces sp. NBC_00083]|uniref:nucleotide sugar dehydrogenase n=1 Tax=Streptomyces sp. NBC_00083 TaxID=2975647 RepID=UPI002253643F|nr:nucleotide sugar dehydrogenase [Streptomyces sp. NBC_00083]MCX5382359.1 nucleotide sugar dehydrogenase [Streptomyces sp. NBC_00083]